MPICGRIILSQLEDYRAAIATVKTGMPCRGRNAPLFQAPWQARIFALIVDAVKAGRFPWTDFQARLVAQIARADESDPEMGDELIERRYFDAWLAAAEETLLALGVIGPGEVERQIEVIRAQVDRIRQDQQPLAIIHK